MLPHRLPARARLRVRGASLVVAVTCIALAGACGTSRTLGSGGDRVRVIATTELLADLVRQVGGDRVEVVALVPPGADPHVHEPTLRDARNVVHADLAVRNGLLLEPRAIDRTLDANLPAGTPDLALAEEAARRGAEVIALVEDPSLDTPWIGFRVHGTGEADGSDTEVVLRAVGHHGPGELFAHVTGTFGEPTFAMDTADGFDTAGGDQVSLPPDAHTHMSWAFTRPGVHRLDLVAETPDPDGGDATLGRTTVTFAVGVDPDAATDPDDRPDEVIDHGHADIGVDLGSRQLRVFWDDGSGSRRALDPEQTVIEVPNRALLEVPPDPAYRRLGRAGTQIHQLPQAVLGAHVHGEIDPHLWQDVANTITYVDVLRDTLIDLDPDGAQAIRSRAAAYVRELELLDDHLRSTVAELPADRRHLVTTHDAFGYLAAAYGLEVSGFVTPDPSAEPSMADRRRLAATIRNLGIRAVFLEPSLRARTSTLTSVAEELDVAVCPIHGDTFVAPIDGYVSMMRANASSLRECLGGT